MMSQNWRSPNTGKRLFKTKEAKKLKHVSRNYIWVRGYRTCLDEGGKCWMLLRNQPLPPGWFEFPMDWKSLGLHLEDIFRNQLEAQSQCTEENKRQFYLQSQLAIYLLVKNELKELVRVLRYATWGAFFLSKFCFRRLLHTDINAVFCYKVWEIKKELNTCFQSYATRITLNFTCKNQDAYSNFVKKMIVNYGCNNVKWLWITSIK